MFACFSLLSFCLFAPTILLPLVREHCELLAEEGRLLALKADLDREYARRESLLEAFSSDVTINERLAVLDLNYHRPNEEVLPVLPRNYAASLPDSPAVSRPSSALLIPSDWPDVARRVERWARRHGLIALFLDRSLRPAILFLAGGLIVSAFVLFAPRGRGIRPQNWPPVSITPREAAASHTST